MKLEICYSWDKKQQRYLFPIDNQAHTTQEVCQRASWAVHLPNQRAWTMGAKTYSSTQKSSNQNEEGAWGICGGASGGRTCVRMM